MKPGKATARYNDQLSWESLRELRRKRQQRKREEKRNNKSLRHEMKIRKKAFEGDRNQMELLK